MAAKKGSGFSLPVALIATLLVLLLITWAVVRIDNASLERSKSNADKFLLQSKWVSKCFLQCMTDYTGDGYCTVKDRYTISQDGTIKKEDNEVVVYKSKCSSLSLIGSSNELCLNPYDIEDTKNTCGVELIDYPSYCIKNSNKDDVQDFIKFMETETKDGKTYAELIEDNRKGEDYCLVSAILYIDEKNNVDKDKIAEVSKKIYDTSKEAKSYMSEYNYYGNTLAYIIASYKDGAKKVLDYSSFGDSKCKNNNCNLKIPKLECKDDSGLETTRDYVSKVMNIMKICYDINSVSNIQSVNQNNQGTAQSSQGGPQQSNNNQNNQGSSQNSNNGATQSFTTGGQSTSIDYININYLCRDPFDNIRSSECPVLDYPSMCEGTDPKHQEVQPINSYGKNEIRKFVQNNKDILEDASSTFGVDKCLIVGVIYAESSLGKRKRSKSDPPSLGMMQVQVATAMERCKENDLLRDKLGFVNKVLPEEELVMCVNKINEDYLINNNNANIYIGTEYLSYLSKEALRIQKDKGYKGYPLHYILAYYNGGGDTIKSSGKHPALYPSVDCNQYKCGIPVAAFECKTNPGGLNETQNHIPKVMNAIKACKEMGLG